MQGSCGYGNLSKSAYPYWSVAALSTQNRFYLAGPINGCGECFEIQCLNSGGQFAVSMLTCTVSTLLLVPLSCQVLNSGSLTVCTLQGRCNSDPSQQSVTVLITDSCPECEADHIDMQALTFNKVGSCAPVC